MSEAAQLYHRENLSDFDWPATPDGDYARRYLQPIIENGPQHYIANVKTDLMVLRVGNKTLPVTKAIWTPENSYVVSPYTHYISYAQEEFANLKSPAIEAFLRLLFIPIASYFRQSELDKAVLVNNWLLSTNLYPQVEDPVSIVAPAIRLLRETFPGHALIFRSVDANRNPALLAALKEQGARPIFSRNIYYQDVGSKYVQDRRDFRADLKLLQKTGYKVVSASTLSDSEIPRLVDLYNSLYLQKHSYYNPQFTEAFVRLALQNNLLTLKALVQNGRIDGVMGYFTRNGVSTAPFFGYDTSLPQEFGLYRLLTARMSLDALEAGNLVHLSAGVGPFKRLRGGLPTIEYNLVYDRHLPLHRQRLWALLQGLMDRVAVPVIQKYGF